MNILPFRGLLPNLTLISNTDRFFQTVKENYNYFHKQHYFLPPGRPAFYVLRMQHSDQVATGLICTTQIQDYLQGKVLKHEKTIHSKEQIQINLLKERKAAVKPVLLVHHHHSQIRRWLKNYTLNYAPTLEVSFSPEEKHLLWEISRPSDLYEVQKLYREKLPTVAIADGHHRIASFATLWQQSKVEDQNQFASVLTAYFPEDELKIKAFHRLVELPDEQQRNKLLQAISKLGTFRPMSNPKLPARKHQMSILSSSNWYDFEWDPTLLTSETDQKPLLDVDLLHQHILVPLLDVKNIQADSRIHYLEGIDQPAQLNRILNAYPSGICFVLYPIHPESFLQIANLGLTLVPKATFFQPRLHNGLVVQTLI